MDIVDAGSRHIEINHQIDAFYIETARRDIGGNQNVDIALRIQFQNTVTVFLIQIAVQHADTELLAPQRAAQTVGLNFGVGKYQRLVIGFVQQQPGQQFLFVITMLRVVPFIVTLGMLGIARGVAKWLAGEQTVNAPASWVNDLLVTFPKPAWLVLPIGVWTALVLAVLAALVLNRTVFGRRVFALGSNEAAARACGVDTGRLRIAIYGIAGCLFGLTGVMQMSRLRQGDPTVANGAELDIIAAVVIGGGSLNGGEGSITGSIIGALIITLVKRKC